MPRGIYARTPREDDARESRGSGDRELRVVQSMTKEELQEANAELKDRIHVQDLELIELRADSEMWQRRCSLYERIIDHITPVRQAG